MFQAATKSRTNFSCDVRAPVDLRQRAKHRVRTEDEIDPGAGPLHLTRLADRAPRTRPWPPTSPSTPCPCRAGSRRSRWSERSRLLGEHPVLGVARALVLSTRMPPISTVISGAVSVSSCALSISSSSAEDRQLCPSGSCGSRPRTARAPRRTRRRSAPARHPCARGEGHRDRVTPAFFAACSTAAQPPSTIRSASETFLPPVAEPLNSFWMPSQIFRTLASSLAVVDLPVLLRSQPDARPVCAAALVGAAEGGRRRPGGGHQLRDRRDPTSGSCALSCCDVLVIDRACGRRPGPGPAR